MIAEWKNNAISTMSAEENLRNVCNQLEQEYVDWRRPAKVRGCRIARQWPAIGELGRYGVKGVVITFVTTHKRSIIVKDQAGMVRGEVRMRIGMAETLYDIAFPIGRELLASTPSK